jgi:hypothetical protein
MIYVASIYVHFVIYPNSNKNCCCEPDGKAEDVNETITQMSSEVAKGGCKIISEHSFNSGLFKVGIAFFSF